MTAHYVPVLREVVDVARKRGDAVERGVTEGAASEDSEPDFDLIEPAPMLRREDEADPRDVVRATRRPRLRPGADVVGDDGRSSPIETREVIEEREHEGRTAVGGRPGDDVATPFAFQRAGYDE
jgi:hypothetical protein